MKIEKADKVGFCFGVKRAIDVLEKVARERGGVETLGAVVHNRQVLQKLGELGVKVAKSVEDICGDVVVTSSHGISPQTEEEIRARDIEIISTTCPFVLRAQVAARRLAEAGFLVVIYGDAEHPEVRGILGWAKGQGIAAFVTLKTGIEGSSSEAEALKSHVTGKIGAIARPDEIYFTAELPKTRSGKIMRRILRKIAEGVVDKESLGDTTTLADPAIIDELIE